ncbi:MAG: hypothetical protein VKS61_14765 [Candidatus Sericytochromatia bacterium]|nr:hypothetical protein [Candidatus Sericytochromatia bacterium]
MNPNLSPEAIQLAQEAQRRAQQAPPPGPEAEGGLEVSEELVEAALEVVDVEDVAEVLSEGFELPGTEALAELASSSLEAVTAGVGELAEGAGALVGGLVEGLGDALPGVLEGAGELAAGAFEVALGGLGELFS